MLNDHVKATGSLKITVVDEATGVVKQEIDLTNLVVSVGRAYIAARMKETDRPTEMSHFALGSGETSPAPTDIALEAELGRVGVTTLGGNVVNNTVSYSATFPAGVATGPLTEAAILNAALDGIMLARSTFPVVNKQAADQISITWTISIN